MRDTKCVSDSSAEDAEKGVPNMNKTVVTTEMNGEDVARYASTLWFSQNTLEHTVGEWIKDATYTAPVDRRAGYAIRELRYRKGTDEQLNQIIDEAIARIQGK